MLKQTMRHLILVRHGETDWNATGRFQGSTDIALNQKGRLQAELTSKYLSSYKIKTIIHSDLIRAAETARIIQSMHPEATLIPDERLRELHYGEWEGKTQDELESSGFPNAYQTFKKEPTKYKPDGAETVEALFARIKSFLDNLLMTNDADTFCIVGHSGSLRALLSIALGGNVETWSNFVLYNCSVSEIQEHPIRGFDVLSLNAYVPKA